MSTSNLQRITHVFLAAEISRITFMVHACRPGVGSSGCPVSSQGDYTRWKYAYEGN